MGVAPCPGVLSSLEEILVDEYLLKACMKIVAHGLEFR